MESDSWDTDVALAPAGPDRRKPRHSLRVLVVALVLAGIAGLVIIPLSLRSGSEQPGGPPAAVGGTPSPSAGPESTEGPDLSGTSATPTPTATRTPTPTRTRKPPPKPKPSTTTRTTAPPTTTAAFDPVTLQAEAGGNTLSGSARVADGLVIGLGDWDAGANGALRFNNVTVPRAGRYSLTFFYTSAAVGGSSGNRTAHISVNGGSAQTFGTSRQDNCCSSGRIDVDLNAGGNTITFTNPSGRCPAIDRIVIARP
jgi:hypothetical protein